VEDNMNKRNTVIILVLILCACAALAALGVFSSGCATVPEWNIKCRHEALITALTAQEHGVQYEIWEGRTEDNVRHAQTRAYVGDQWLWLRWDAYGGNIAFSTSPDPFTPKYRSSIDHAVNFWFAVKEE